MSQLMPGIALGFLLTDVSRLFRQSFDERVEISGLALTHGEIRVLAYIATYPSSRQVHLACLLGVEAMTLSAYVDSLERQGFVKREPDPRDRRANVVCATGKVEAILDQVRPIAQQTFERATKDLTSDSLGVTERVLVNMRQNLLAEVAR